MLLLALSAQAEIKIISSKSWSPTITGSWTNKEGLSYRNTVYGDTYYNSEWQDMSTSQEIQHKDIYRYFYLRPDSKRDWKFTLPIINLSAKKGHSYWATSTPNNKQKSSQIYWGISIGFKVDGAEKNVYFWLKRSAKKYDSYGNESYGSEKYISYSVANGDWEVSYIDYPSCDPSSTTSLEIKTNTYGRTSISWGGFMITSFSSYVEEITYIEVMVGTQADIQIGKPYAYASGVDEENIYVAADYMAQENYAMVKQKLYRADQSYYEGQAVNLSLAYVMLDEVDSAMELCNALIKYNGESLQYAYFLRGLLNENKGKKLDALEDYQKAGDQENYNRLYNEIYRPKSTQKSTQQRQNSGKPPLTK